MSEQAKEPERSNMLVRMPGELHERLRRTSVRERLSANKLILLGIEQIVRRSEFGIDLLCQDDN